MAPAGPYKLVTVNTAPERAFRLIGRVVEHFKDQYTIIHAANVDSEQQSLGPYAPMPLIPNTVLAIEGVRAKVEEVKPDVLVCQNLRRCMVQAAHGTPLTSSVSLPRQCGRQRSPKGSLPLRRRLCQT